MTNHPYRLPALIVALGVIIAITAPAAQAQEISPGTGPEWLWAPRFFPKGAKITLVAGDPNAAGPLAIELIFPDRYEIKPHYHAADLHVRIKQGTMIVGIGDRVQWQKVFTLVAGDTATVPAGVHSFYKTKGMTWIAVTTTGPFTQEFVWPSDDPSAPKPFGSN